MDRENKLSLNSRAPDLPVESSRSAAAALSALAAILPEVRRERAQGVVVGAVEDERPLFADLEELGGGEALQVVAERRRGEIDVLLNFAGGGAARIALDDAAEDSEAHGTATRAE